MLATWHLLLDDMEHSIRSLARLRERGVRADTIVRELAEAAGGKGGGKPHMAQAGFPDAAQMASVPTRIGRVMID